MLNALVCFSSTCWTMNALLDAYSLIVAKERVFLIKKTLSLASFQLCILSTLLISLVSLSLVFCKRCNGYIDMCTWSMLIGKSFTSQTNTSVLWLFISCTDVIIEQISNYNHKIYLNPIPTGHGLNQPIYERHVTKSGRNRVKKLKKKIEN